jgi:hypothetical protein
VEVGGHLVGEQIMPHGTSRGSGDDGGHGRHDRAGHVIFLSKAVPHKAGTE